MKVTKKVYQANCIENGERFFSLFQTNETGKANLLSMGADLAVDWGAECISVKAFTPKSVKMVKMWDIKEKGFIELTERRYNNWVKKHPRSLRYDYAKTEYFADTEAMPTDVWDSDLSTKENLAESKKV